MVGSSGGVGGYVCGRPVGEVGAPDPSPETGAPSGRRPDPRGGPPGTDAAPELVWAAPRRIRNAIAIPTPMKAAMITGNSNAEVPKASTARPRAMDVFEHGAAAGG